MSDKLEHSPIGASGMYRWAVCPGSVRLCKDLPRRTSVYAEEGTEAHALAAAILKDQTIDAPAEMFEAVSVYTYHCQELSLAAGAGSRYFVEHEFDLSFLHPDLWGTADFVLWDPESRILYVRDYKHGAGILVEVSEEHGATTEEEAVEVDNPQLMYYALGALLTLKFPALWVDIGIVQPRCPHPDGPIRTKRIHVTEFVDFAAHLVERAKATTDPNAMLVAGDHCRFCPAAGICPELRRCAQELAKIEFSQPQAYDPMVLATALQEIPMILAWVKHVREFAYMEALRGNIAPGYKLVDKIPRRKWRREADTIEVLADKFQLDDSDLYERTLRSPADMEKTLKAHAGKEWKALRPEFDALCIKVSSGTTLVPVDDKRPPARTDAASEFKLLEHEDMLND